MSPIYVYECVKCEKAIEKLSPVGRGDEETLCPSCEEPMQKVFGRSNFTVKGYSFKNGYSSTDKSKRK